MLNQWSPTSPLQNRTQNPTRKARAATFERRGRTQATKALPFFCWSEMPRNAFYTVYVSFLVANRKTKVNKRETVQKYSVQTDLSLFSFSFFFLAELHGLQNLIPSQGSNLCRLQWKHGVLTTEPSRKYPKQIYLSLCFMKHWKYQIFLGFYSPDICLHYFLINL